jgi:thiol:disulfide interchange protein DsbA
MIGHVSSLADTARARANSSGAMRIALFATLLASLALTACGSKKETASVAAQPVEENLPAPEQLPTAENAAPADDNSQGTAEQLAAAVPAETISETEDGGAPDTSSAATVQSPLRLGGPATTKPTSAKFKEGANYTKLVPAQPTSVGPGKVEVVEVFWYGCGHCFALEPALESWHTKGKPAAVELVRIPAMWNDATRMHARVFFTAEVLGKLDELHTPIFREINMKGNPLNTVDRISALFREHGVSSDEFQKAFSSFAVENKLQRADLLNRRYRIESVPSVVVNGKYKTDVSMAGGEQQLFGLINELAAHEAG